MGVVTYSQKQAWWDEPGAWRGACLGNILFLATFLRNQSVKFLETLLYWLHVFTWLCFNFTIGETDVSFTRLNMNIFCVNFYRMMRLKTTTISWPQGHACFTVLRFLYGIKFNLWKCILLFCLCLSGTGFESLASIKTNILDQSRVRKRWNASQLMVLPPLHYKVLERGLLKFWRPTEIWNINETWKSL